MPTIALGSSSVGCQGVDITVHAQKHDLLYGRMDGWTIKPGVAEAVRPVKLYGCVPPHTGTIFLIQSQLDPHNT